MINEQLKRLVKEKLYNTSYVLQPINACIICVIEFNIITTYMMVFQNKRIYIIILFIYYMTDMISLIYSMFSPSKEK